MRRTFTIIFLLITIIASLAISRYDLDGIVTVTSAFVHTAGGDYKLDISQVCLHLLNEIGIDALWKEVCLGAEKYGCVLGPCDKIIIFLGDMTGLETVAIVAADKEILSQEFIYGFSAYVTL